MWRGVWYRGRNEGMGRDFKKEEKRGCRTEVSWTTGPQNNFLKEIRDASLLET